MKKVYVVAILAVATSLAGCTLKAPIIPELSTGDVQTITGTELTGTELTGEELTGMVETGLLLGEELTGSIDSGVVPMVSGSNEITAQQSGINNEVKKLIEERKTKPKDTTKLTEEDIGLMEQIIQKVQNLGK